MVIGHHVETGRKSPAQGAHSIGGQVASKPGTVKVFLNAD
jgi:hypothetical protein